MSDVYVSSVEPRDSTYSNRTSRFASRHDEEPLRGAVVCTLLYTDCDDYADIDLRTAKHQQIVIARLAHQVGT